MHGIEYLFVLMRACHGKDAGMVFADVFWFCAQTACHDHATVFIQRFANGLKTFGFGAVEKPAGVHDHRVRPGIIWRHAVAFGPEPRQDTLRIDQRLGAAQRYHADRWLTRAAWVRGFWLWRYVIEPRLWREIGTQIWWVCAHDCAYSPTQRAAKARQQ